MGELLDRSLADTNLRQALDKVVENGGCAGVDGESLTEVAWLGRSVLDDLRNDVLRGAYQPKPLLGIEIPKPAGGSRQLAVPAVRDRILQTAVALVTGPILDAEFADVSFGYRTGRSVDQALGRVRALRESGYRYVVDADIDIMRRWLAGDKMTLADFAAAAHLSSLDYIRDVDWNRNAVVKDWYAKIKSRPAFRSILADNVPGFPQPPHYADLDF